MRTLMVSEAMNGLPGPFLAVLVFWAVVLFFGYGLLSAALNQAHHAECAVVDFPHCRIPIARRAREAETLS
jgi:hypothetical protein